MPFGSILALTDDAGVVQTAYTYDPFGQTTVTGQGSGNSFQYTGRENDGTGLYYYRARYYHPGRQRFISEDPIEFASGDTNLYAYVENSPLAFRDPFGLDKDRDGCAGGATTFEDPVIREALREALAQQATRQLEQSGMVFQNRWTRNVGYRLIDDFWASRTGTQMDKIGWIEALVYRPIVTFHTHPIGPSWPAYNGPSDTDVKTFMRRYPRAGQYHIVVNESRVYTISPSGTTCQIGWTPSAIAR